MSNEIKVPPSNPPVLSGPVYAIVYNDALQIWSGTAWVADTTADRLLAQIACALTGVFWLGNFPVSLTVAGTYSVIVYLQAGGAPATTDTPIDQGSISWSGTAELPLPVNTVLVNGMVAVPVTIPTTGVASITNEQATITS